MKTKKLLLLMLSLFLVVSLCLTVLIACDPEDDDEFDTSIYEVDMDIGENVGTFEEFNLSRPEGQRQLIVYWREKAHDYSDNDIWMWYGDVAGRAYELHECSYGGVTAVNVPADTEEVGFIVRAGATSHGTEWGSASKVYDADRFVKLTGDVTVIYLTGSNQYQFVSSDGGKTISIMTKIEKITISDLNEISYIVAPATKLSRKSDIKVTCNGKNVAFSDFTSRKKTTDRGIIKLKSDIDLSQKYYVTIEGYGEQVALPLEVFDSKSFAERYHYDGDDLGVNIKDGNVEFKLWAPTADKVTLNIFNEGNGGIATQTVDMTLGEKGVWKHTAEYGVIGKYYTYTVSTAEGNQEAVDPYAKSAGVNGQRGMIIDLATTNPDGFGADKYLSSVKTYTEAVIWETHVRDFSNNIASSQYKGKYLAFTETGLTNSHGIPVGVDYVKNLGITHIHLLPVFDYKSVDEAATEPQFNWGYDPQNYNVPEGSYSTDPYHGEVRVKEYKQMVQALHNQGLGVIMDMVYNHTYDSNSNLNKVVPNYYYRYNADGSNSNGSGCGNDTASERYMFRKYMVDSVSYWTKEYHLDGLRFDLMGLHDIETMQAIEKAVHAINPNAIIYGEGWTLTTAAKEGTVLATQRNINQITASTGSAGAIAVFNDVIRDGLRGSTFTATQKGYMANPIVGKSDVMRSVAGCEDPAEYWYVNNGAVINYISAHDNHTLWDKLAISASTNTVSERLNMNRIGATIVMISKGTPFMQSGEEMLRSKKISANKYDENSYKSSDAINNIKWESLKEGSNEYNMMLYYKGLIEMRRSSKVLMANSGVAITTVADKTRFVATFDGGADGKVIVVVNNATSDYAYTLPAGNWSLVCNGTQAGSQEIEQASGQVNVKASSVYVYFSK